MCSNNNFRNKYLLIYDENVKNYFVKIVKATVNLIEIIILYAVNCLGNILRFVLQYYIISTYYIMRFFLFI